MTFSNAITSSYLDSRSISSLKNIAFLIMLIDHIGIIFYPDVIAFRIIGRIAFPIFAFITIYNFVFNSKDKQTQILNIYILALISQFTFILAFPHGLNYLNIFFLFLLVMTFLFVYESTNNKALIYISFLSLAFLSCFAEYGFFGFMFMLFLYIFFKLDSSKFNLFMVFISAFFINGFISPVYISVAVLTVGFLFVLYLENKSLNLIPYRFNKYFYYGFYPLHLLILSGISTFNCSCFN